MLVARASAACRASTNFKFCAWNTRRTMANASGEVTRKPSMVFFSIPAADSSTSNCGPAPWMTMGVRPTSCKNASDETSASRSSRNTAPPTLTTAKRAASNCEKRFKYCEISLALPMLDSNRTMVWRVCGSCTACELRIGVTANPLSRSLSKNADDGVGIALKLRQCHPFVGGVRLCNIARAIHECGQAGLRKQRGLGPEIHRVAHRQVQRFGE